MHLSGVRIRRYNRLCVMRSRLSRQARAAGYPPELTAKLDRLEAIHSALGQRIDGGRRH